jgi:acyl-CoA reductase-like NAD-dependent aldehyde dehydrogenase
MAPDDDSFRLPLYCPLIINGEEGKAASGRQFTRENPADIRQVATIAEQGTLEDARAAIDAARAAFDSNVGNWIYNYKLREQALIQTARLMRANADRLARVVSLEVECHCQAAPHHGRR